MVCIGCKFCKGYPDTVPYCEKKRVWVVDFNKRCEEFKPEEKKT